MRILTDRRSPNRSGALKDYRFIVLHHTATTDFDSTVRYLCNPAAQASANYVVGKRGQVAELVPPGIAAWHAGKGSGFGIPADSMNSYSVGIEIVNMGDGKDVFAPLQLEALDELIAYLDRKMGKQARIIDHKAWAPTRKVDMRANFPLEKYQKYRRHTGEEHAVYLLHCGLHVAYRDYINPAWDADQAAHVVAVGEGFTAALSHADALAYVAKDKSAANMFAKPGKRSFAVVAIKTVKSWGDPNIKRKADAAGHACIPVLCGSTTDYFNAVSGLRAILDGEPVKAVFPQ